MGVVAVMLLDPNFSELRPLIIDGVNYGEFALTKLCWWAHTLNEWNWPSDFPMGKPDHFDDLDDHSMVVGDEAPPTKFADEEFRLAVDGVRNTMTLYEDLYHHNTFNLGHTISHFKEHWRGT